MRTIVLTLAAALPMRLSAQAIDVRTGLWETTIRTDAAGIAALVDGSGMSAEQKARLEAMMKNMGGPPELASRSCVTAEQLDEKSASPIGGDSDCQYRYTTRSARKLAGTVTCHKRGATQTGDFSFEASERDAIDGVMRMQRAPGAGTTTMTMSSRWLAADCGDVKPRSTVKTK